MQPNQIEPASSNHPNNKILDRFPVKQVQLHLPIASGPGIGSIFFGMFCFLLAGGILVFACVANSQMDSTNVFTVPLALITIAASLVGSVPFVLAGVILTTIGITLRVARKPNTQPNR